MYTTHTTLYGTVIYSAVTYDPINLQTYLPCCFPTDLAVEPNHGYYFLITSSGVSRSRVGTKMPWQGELRGGARKSVKGADKEMRGGVRGRERRLGFLNWSNTYACINKELRTPPPMGAWMYIYGFSLMISQSISAATTTTAIQLLSANYYYYHYSNPHHNQTHSASVPEYPYPGPFTKSPGYS